MQRAEKIKGLVEQLVEANLDEDWHGIVRAKGELHVAINELQAAHDGYQRHRAQLFDQLNGTPCAQLRSAEVVEQAAMYRYLRENYATALLRLCPATKPYEDAAGEVDDAVRAAMKRGA